MRMSLEEIFLQVTTEERVPEEAARVRNILAIADKELRSYFASPIAYIMIGLFALLFGWFFYVYLMAFVQQSEQMMQFGGGGAPNVNQMMIRGAVPEHGVIILFVMPMITMRTYSEEKRSGTIELLLTSPLTDLRDHPRQVPRRDGALYAAMLLVTMIYIGILFMLGNPEWRPIAAGYLGLLLMGGCFISLGLFISSLTKNQIVAGFLTFATFLMLWIINWLGERPGRRRAEHRSSTCRSPSTSTISPAASSTRSTSSIT